MKMTAGPGCAGYKFIVGKYLQSIKSRVFSVLGIQKSYSQVLYLYKTSIKLS